MERQKERKKSILMRSIDSFIRTKKNDNDCACWHSKFEFFFVLFSFGCSKMSYHFKWRKKTQQNMKKLYRNLTIFFSSYHIMKTTAIEHWIDNDVCVWQLVVVTLVVVVVVIECVCFIFSFSVNRSIDRMNEWMRPISIHCVIVCSNIHETTKKNHFTTTNWLLQHQRIIDDYCCCCCCW